MSKRKSEDYDMPELCHKVISKWKVCNRRKGHSGACSEFGD